MTKRLLPLLFPCLLSTNLAPADGLLFAPAANSRWRKNFEQQEVLDFQGMTVNFGGQEVPPEYLPEMEMHMESTLKIVFFDEYGELESGRPSKLTREHETIEARHHMDFSMSGEQGAEVSHEGAVEGRSPLAGERVQFTWDGERQEWQRTSDGDLDTSLLEGLVEECDLRSWLPEDDPEVGTTWSIDAECLEGFLQPGGELALELEGEGAEYWEETILDKRMSGEVKMTLRSRDRDLATIAVEAALRVTETKEGDLSQVPVVQGDATEVDTLNYELSGELVWDLGLGMLRSAHLEGPMTLESVTTKDGGEPTYEQVMSFSGKCSFSGSLELLQ